MSSKNSKDLRLDSIMKELDVAITTVDSPDTEIEEAIATYEHATSLLQLAAQKLADIEQVVETLNRSSQPPEIVETESD